MQSDRGSIGDPLRDMVVNITSDIPSCIPKSSRLSESHPSKSETNNPAIIMSAVEPGLILSLRSFSSNACISFLISSISPLSSISFAIKDTSSAFLLSILSGWMYLYSGIRSPWMWELLHHWSRIFDLFLYWGGTFKSPLKTIDPFRRNKVIAAWDLHHV